MEHRDAKEKELEVRSRQTFRGGAEPTVEVTVVCPRSEADAPLEECLRCADWIGLAPAGNDGDGNPIVLCDAPEEQPVGTPAFAGSGEFARVGTIMTTRVICAGPELPVGELEALLLDSGISGVPVVDAAGRAIGIVSKTDLLGHHRQQREPGHPCRCVVADIMMPMAFCLRENETISKAAALMAFENMHRVPVVNTRREVVGLVSSLDVMRWMARRHGYVIGLRPHQNVRRNDPSP